MHDLNDLFYFAKVVEAGGFAAAGRLLGIPKSRLSRRIAELENRLGARLLQRTTRKLALTDIGERYLRHCQAMLQEAEQAEETVASLTSEPRGRLRVSAPGGIALLPELVVSFLAAYPKVQLELIQTNRRVDLLNGLLVRLLPDWTLPPGHLQAVYTHRRGMLPAVRAWIEHIDQAFKDWEQPV